MSVCYRALAVTAALAAAAAATNCVRGLLLLVSLGTATLPVNAVFTDTPLIGAMVVFAPVDESAIRWVLVAARLL